MFHVVLYQPEIPPNTGNIIRLCANTGSQLHLIKPLGFELEDKKLRRAGLDYREWASVAEHDTFESFCEQVQPKRIWAVSTHGSTIYSDVQYRPQDIFLFGPETRGLPRPLLENLGWEHVIRIPMVAESRSLNLSNSAAVLVYEAWRQQGFSRGG
ncbi:MAG: tRNA (uridine(34)/cytosine(34)/5-carboxymethylaminomethyluridine(34)-2'-O)-methyltransferase TrmL [Gammaproteobacteria bacterium]|nr:MAG: tRNA (uridine(34)/cytosine(34)/5-carboxymethylaminomethyluridine(34)-2'-O)-methyltransferase TrmL [Gammaproteobacteria bacterium]